MMNILNVCPCCANPMVRHVNNHKQYWFCRSCWQEMPDLDTIRQRNYHLQNRLVNLSVSSSELDRAFVV